MITSSSERVRYLRLLCLSLSCLPMLACADVSGADELGEDGVESTGTQSFEEWKAGLRHDEFSDTYFYEDMHFGASTLRDFYEQEIHDATALTDEALANGRPSLVSRTNRTSMNYCVSNEFTATERANIITAFATATSNWENAINNDGNTYIQFNDVTPAGGCAKGATVASGTNVYFDIRKDPTCSDGNGKACVAGAAGCGCSFAHSFFPSEASDRGNDFVMLQQSLYRTAAGAATAVSAGLMTHELGHVLGFRHEWNNSNSPPCAKEGGSLLPVTWFDPNSVMAYSSGACATSSVFYTITNLDRIGAQLLYQDDSLSGSRNYSLYYGLDRGSELTTGKGNDIYQIIDGEVMSAHPSRLVWTHLGPDDTQPIRAAKVLAGGGQLFMLDTDGNIWKHGAGTSWTLIGGPGAQFVVTHDGMLFALNPARTQVNEWLGTGGWLKVGGAAQRLVAGNGTVFAVLSATDVRRWDGTTGSTAWTKISTVGYPDMASDYSGTLFGAKADGSVFRYTGTGTTWKAAGAVFPLASAKLYSGRSVYMRDISRGTMWSFVNTTDGAGGWLTVHPRKVIDFADNGSRRFARTSAGGFAAIVEMF